MIRNYSTINYFDDDLNNERDIFFKTMNSFHTQRKAEENFMTETNNNISAINSYYYDEEWKFRNEFRKQKKLMIDDYSNSISPFDYNREAKIGEMNNIYDTASRKFLERINNRRLQAIKNYKQQRSYQYNNMIENHNNFWKKKSPKLLLSDEYLWK